MTLEHLDTLIAFVVIITGISLLVTTLTQMISAFFGLRGSNLRWGIETLLKQVDPNLTPYAETVSEKVLQHALISDSTLSGIKVGFLNRWKLATAIGKNELIGVLHMLADQPDESGTSPESWLVALRQSLDQLDPGEADKLLKAAPEIGKVAAVDASTSADIISRLTSTAERLTIGINQWFDSMMNRVSQRFVMHMRIWTIVFSVVVAFALHLDAFRLFTQLSGDSEMRAKLVAAADALKQKAEGILASTPDDSSVVYGDAMKALLQNTRDSLKTPPVPSDLTNMAAARNWLSGQLTAAGVTDTAQWMQKYQTLVAQTPLLKAANNFSSILNDKLTVQLVPDPYPNPFYSYWTPGWLHFWGIVVSAALLSLGAPFWFNILKSLSNLRPILASKEQKESEAASK